MAASNPLSGIAEGLAADPTVIDGEQVLATGQWRAAHLGNVLAMRRAYVVAL